VSARSRRLLTLCSIAAAISAAAWLQQGEGENQNAHHALVKALARGTPWIDETMREVGHLSTQDVTPHEGHVYSNKAPGLAFVALPAHAAFEALGGRTRGDTTTALWVMGLWALVLPVAVMLVLVAREAERLEPGYGAIAAAVAGTATIVLPFATLLYAHALSAALVFGAFAAVAAGMRSRRLSPVALGGFLAGYAVTTEYSSAVALGAIGLYALARGDAVRRAGAYALGALAGLLPLLAYNWWAFDSLVRSSYEGTTVGPGTVRGLFGAPSLQGALEIMFSSIGLFVFSPVLIAGVAALPAVIRRDRALGVFLAALAVAYLVWTSMYFIPLGGFGLGPRLLVPLIPFLALPLAVAYRAQPVPVLATAAVSAATLATVTVTHPFLAFDGNWLDRLLDGDVSRTVAGLFGITGWYVVIPVFVAVAVAIAAAAVAAPWPGTSWRSAAAAAVALSVWAWVLVRAPQPTEIGGSGELLDYVLLLALAVAATALVLFADRILVRGERRVSDVVP
jgi:hypothetical protein